MAVLAVFLHQHLRAEAVSDFKRRHNAYNGRVRVLAFSIPQPGTHDRKAALRTEADLIHTSGHAERFGREASAHARQDSALSRANPP